MKFLLFLLQFIVFFLAACGSSDIPTTATTSTTAATHTAAAAPSYLSLTDEGAKTSVLGGFMWGYNDTNSTLVGPETIRGTLNHQSGGATVDDGVYRLADNDGFDENWKLTDGVSTLSVSDIFPNQYQYVKPYELNYVAPSGASYSTGGFLGIITSPDDVPSFGIAVYEGDAAGQFDYTMLTNGKSRVVANFYSGTVDVELSNFSAEFFDGTSTTSPIDTLSASQLRIVGNTFVGGEAIVIMKDGVQVNLTGTPIHYIAQGNFYGFDTSHSAPSEVAGGISLESEYSVVKGAFIADLD